MEVHKKFGTIVMVFPIMLWFLLITLAEDRCFPGAPAASSVMSWLSFCIRLVIARETPHSENYGVTYIPGTYLALACLMIFAVGFLWYRNALPVPHAVSKYLSVDNNKG